jgi:hypothetical protein
MAAPIIVVIGGTVIKYASKKLAEAAAKNIGGKVISKPTKAMIDKAVSPRSALKNNPTLVDKIKAQFGISPKQSKSMPLVGRSDRSAGIDAGKLTQLASRRRAQFKTGIPIALITGKAAYEIGKEASKDKPKKKVEQAKKKPNIPPKAPPSRPKKKEDSKKKNTQLYMKEKNTGKDSKVKFNSRGGMLKKGKK